MQKMDDMTDTLKASDEFNAWLTTYIDYEFSIRNGATKLKKARQDMVNSAHSVQDKIKIAKEFTDYFTTNDIEGKVQNVHRLTAMEDSSTTRNLFGLLVNKFGCDILELSRLMSIIQDVMVLGAQQTISYYSMKGYDDRGTKYYAEVVQQMYEIRTRYNEYIWKCHNNAIADSKDEVRKAITNGRDTAHEQLAKEIFNKLASLYPFYAWAVISTDKTDSRAESDGPYHFPDLQKVLDDAVNTKGSQFYVMSGKYTDKDRKVIVSWQNAADQISCAMKESATTDIFYLPCDSCLDDLMADIPKSDTILTRKKCNGKVFKEPDFNLIQDPNLLGDPGLLESNKRMLTTEVQKWYWIAVGLPITPSACSVDVCHGHGICQQIPHTSRTLCLCHPLYDGEDCSEYNDPAPTEEIIKLIAEMRGEYAETAGIPDVVDVYFAIANVSDSIQDGLHRVQDSLEYIEQLTKYAEDMQKASYMSRIYSRLQNGEIDDLTFVAIMEKFLRTESATYILDQVKNALMGKGILDVEGHDFLNSFKRAYVAKYNNPCTPNYVSDVTRMLQNLAGLDTSVSEALMQYVLLSQPSVSTQTRTSLMDQVRKNAASSIERQQAYKKYWSDTSCGALSTENLVQSYCRDMHSYSGMKIQLSCMNGKKPSTGQLQCVKSKTQLDWDSDVSCDSYWTSWSQWSTCSKTCGGGTSTRNRVLQPDGQQGSESKACNTDKCCQEKFGKFECSNGKCISLSQVCNARNDCGDYQDETASRCPDHIRSFDHIHLKSDAFTGGYFDCYGTVNMGYKTCRVRKTGQGHRFRMRLQTDSRQLAIKNGDKVGVQYGWGQPAGHNKWVHCGGGTGCEVDTSNCADKDVSVLFNNCPDLIWTIYSPDSRVGDPIKVNDRVFLERFRGHWLSAMEVDHPVKLRTCPGYSVADDDTHCINERWTVIRAP